MKYLRLYIRVYGLLLVWRVYVSNPIFYARNDYTCHRILGATIRAALHATLTGYFEYLTILWSQGWIT
jgi:hypothetical protein